MYVYICVCVCVYIYVYIYIYIYIYITLKSNSFLLADMPYDFFMSRYNNSNTRLRALNPTPCVQ